MTRLKSDTAPGEGAVWTEDKRAALSSVPHSITGTAEKQSPPDLDLRADALDYALSLGWHVFPCEPGGKAPLARLVPHGHLDATTDEARIVAWWTKEPNANIGVSCPASGLVVVDCDGAAGLASWSMLRSELRIDDATTKARTGGGGQHIFYAANGHNVGDDTTGKLGDRVHVKARGYVVLPPSLHPSGRRYEWAESPLDTAPLPLPDALAHELAKPTSTTATDRPRASVDVVRELPKAKAALARLAPHRCDVYGEWVNIGMALSELGEAGFELWDGWSKTSAKYDRDVCVKHWASFKPGVGVKLATLYHHAREDSPPELPRLNASEQQLPVLSAEAWRAIEAANDPPRLFRHGGRPVRLEVEEDAPSLSELNTDRLRHELARAARWYKKNPPKTDGDPWHESAAKPPMDTVRDMLAYPAQALPLPPVDRIAQAPVFSASGLLQAEPGYHESGRVIVHLDPGLVVAPVPTAPTRADLSAAVAMIDDLLADFPLVDAADRAHCFALALVPFVRDMIAGPTPLHLFEAPTAGAGKGLLTAALLTPAVGSNLATLSAGRDDDEWRKRITSVLRAGRPAVLIDNVAVSIESGALSSALTTGLWEDRVLGASEMMTLPVRCVWAATGNNPMLSTEIARRCIRVRLDPKMDRPWRREQGTFRHPALLEYARAHRGELIAAALTIVQSWIAAGKPKSKTPPLGSFEVWARVIGGILGHAGIRGFLGNLDELYDRADSEGAQWRRLVRAWWDAHDDKPVGVADLYILASAMDEFDFGAAKTEKGERTVLGKMLRAKEDAVLGGYRIMRAGTLKHNAQYRLQQAHTDLQELGT